MRIMYAVLVAVVVLMGLPIAAQAAPSVACSSVTSVQTAFEGAYIVRCAEGGFQVAAVRDESGAVLAPETGEAAVIEVYARDGDGDPTDYLVQNDTWFRVLSGG